MTQHVTAARTIVFCALGAVCEGMDLQAAGVAASGIAAEFRPTADQLGTFFSASTLGLFVGALIGGRLADRIGRKAVLVCSMLLFGVFSLLTPLAWDMQSLVYARLLTGLGLGGALPMLIALAAESSAEHRRNVNVAAVYSGNPLGGGLISVVAMLILGSHWRTLFIVGGVLPLLLAPMMAWGLRESAAFRSISAGRALSRQATSLREIFSAGRAAPTLLLWSSFFLGLLTLYLLLNWLPTLLMARGLTRSQAAMAQIGFNIGGALAALLTGVLLESRARGVIVALTFIALPSLLFALAQSSAPLPVILTLVLLLGCAVLSGQAFMYAVAPSLYPTSVRGLGVGAAVAIGRIGSFIGPKLGGYLKSAGHGYSRLLMDLLPIVILGSVAAIALAWYSARRAGLAADLPAVRTPPHNLRP